MMRDFVCSTRHMRSTQLCARTKYGRCELLDVGGGAWPVSEAAGCCRLATAGNFRKVVAGVQSCTGSKVHNGAWVSRVGCSCGLSCWWDWVSLGTCASFVCYRGHFGSRHWIEQGASCQPFIGLCSVLFSPTHHPWGTVLVLL